LNRHGWQRQSKGQVNYTYSLPFAAVTQHEAIIVLETERRIILLTMFSTTVCNIPPWFQNMQEGGAGHSITDGHSTTGESQEEEVQITI
jgi:hypothetical protein